MTNSEVSGCETKTNLMTSEENKSLANDVSIEKPKVSAVVKTDDRVEAKQMVWMVS